jgi:hypothetical protein
VRREVSFDRLRMQEASFDRLRIQEARGRMRVIDDDRSKNDGCGVAGVK